MQIAYEVEKLDEGGAHFWATYPSLDAALAALEEFLQRKLSDWALRDLEEETAKGSPDHEALARAIEQRTIPFPRGAEFELEAGYWSRFQ